MKSIHKYRPDIDGLRAVAVLGVVGFHAAPGYMPGGFVGVDVFFVISGFLISDVILQGIRNNEFSYADFYARRIRRLFPALILVLLTTVILGWLLLLPNEYERLVTHVVSGVFFVSNFTLLNEIGYFDTASELKPLLHLWSLGVEEQFYLLWPAMLALMWWARKRVLLGVVLVGIISFSLNIAMINKYPMASFYLPFTRFWELMLGASIAASPVVRIPTAFRNVCSVIGVALIVASIMLFSSDAPFPGWRALAPTVGTGLILAAGTKAWCNHKLLATGSLVFVGLISYPLYLWHWPLLSFLRIIAPLPPGLGEKIIRVSVVAVSFALAFGTYRLFEIKIRSATQSKYVYRLVASLVAVAVIGVAAQKPLEHIYALRENPFVWEGARNSTPSCLDHFLSRKISIFNERWSLYCLQSHPEKSPTVLLISDSVANQWMPGIIKQDPGLGLLNLGGGGCPYLFKVQMHTPPLVHGPIEAVDPPENNECYFVMSRVFDILKAGQSIDTVILAANMTAIIPGTGEPGADYLPSRFLTSSVDGKGGGNAEIYTSALRRTLEDISSLGKRIIIILEIPNLGFDPKSCVRLRALDAFKSLREPCAVNREIAEKYQRNYRRITRMVASEFPGVVVLDPFDSLCDNELCYGIREGRVMYRNENHLTVDGSEFMWPLLEKAIALSPLRH